jgi:hypothetical protein
VVTIAGGDTEVAEHGNAFRGLARNRSASGPAHPPN